ncbi:hypothetical protein FJ444_05825 [Aestuariibacter sp. GS-14]|uniref:hypothetical protein n=1 Tax=Aestuariibacter sp. GS-14 TaxID=2590670 RepID=UPI001126C128|nr:hypothetical protein [Aestuariibacter sp. GS-14]TPV59686.1 hypothetical protein FJ444_05825 [Aestuariibacter sp. GS-14]
MKFALLLFLILNLSGCISTIGDNVAYVTGEVSEECTLRFKNEQTENRNHQTRVINGKFAADFTISPSPSDYELSIECQGNTILKRNVSLPNQQKELNLGVIYSAKT